MQRWWRWSPGPPDGVRALPERDAWQESNASRYRATVEGVLRRVPASPTWPPYPRSRPNQRLGTPHPNPRSRCDQTTTRHQGPNFLRLRDRCVTTTQTRELLRPRCNAPTRRRLTIDLIPMTRLLIAINSSAARQHLPPARDSGTGPCLRRRTHNVRPEPDETSQARDSAPNAIRHPAPSNPVCALSAP